MRGQLGGAARPRTRHGIARLAVVALLAALPRLAPAQDVLCDPGERQVRAVHFIGNGTFDDDELSARVITTPSSLTRRYLRAFGARRCYPDVGLAPDVAALQQFYRNNGFFDTTVDTAVSTVSRDVVDITFRIAEGQPLILDSLAITGLDSVPARDRVLRDSLLHIGGRFGPLLLASQVDTLTRRLRNAGYPHAVVLQSYTTHVAEHRAEVDLDIRPGPLTRFGVIDVNSIGVKGGAPSIDSAVVLGLLGFRTGDVYSDRALNDASRNLYNLSAYRHVGIATDSVSAQGDSIADVVVDLREDYMHEVNHEEGWATLDCFRLNTQYVDKNFQNKAHRLEVTARFSKLGYGAPTRSSFTRNLCYRRQLDADSIGSSKVNDYIGATIRYPTLFGYHWVPSYSVYTERRGQYKAYLRSTDIGLGANATRDISAATPFQLGYTFEHGQTRAEPAVLCGLFSRCTPEERDDVQRRLALGLATASLQRSTTDNLVAPTRGYVAAAQVGYSATFLASDPSQQFEKATVDVSWYRALFRGTTFAARARAGLIRGGQLTNGVRLPPPQERLYAGGPTSVRGFQQNELGPQVYLLELSSIDTTRLTDSTLTFVAKPGARQNRSIPGGGNEMVVLNAELRIRDPFIPDYLEYVPFVDAGQVWTSEGNKPQINLRDLLVTPGLSLRYYSPVGPIQLNAGYNRYPPRRGAAYFLAPPNFLAPENTTTNRAPLICVTPRGVAPLIVTQRNGELVQDVAACPSVFVPGQPSNFFKHLTLSLSIGTDF
jgi:outer membrane protein insertion porin family/translocation and assembly module TamA